MSRYFESMRGKGKTKRDRTMTRSTAAQTHRMEKREKKK